MNYKNWTPRRFWVVLGIVFFLGLLFSPKTQDRVITREVVKQQSCDYSQWKELKSIDDDGFVYCKDGFDAASEGFYAIATNDTAKMQSATKSINDTAEFLRITANRRQKVLKDLGY